MEVEAEAVVSGVMCGWLFIEGVVVVEVIRLLRVEKKLPVGKSVGCTFSCNS